MILWGKNIESDIRQRIIVNGQPGSGWRFTRFNQLHIHVKSDKLEVGM